MEEKPREWYENQPLTIEALEDGYLNLYELNTYQKKYSLDGGCSWENFGDDCRLYVAKGSHVMISSLGIVHGYINLGIIRTTFKFNVYGNVKSLECGLKFQTQWWPKELTLAYLFSVSQVVDASNLILPTDTMERQCYLYMFANCTSLTRAPQLLATELEEYCYARMFTDCTSLTEAPKLLATTLANKCYQGMFANCSSLKEAPQLPATRMTNECYRCMFYCCTSLKEAPQLPATTLEPSCYGGMFKGCTSLTTAPQLLAKTLSVGCYRSMFEGCTSLKVAPQLPATTLADYCYDSMFYRCKSLEKAPHKITVFNGLENSGHDTMFENCGNLKWKTIFINASIL